MKYEILNKEESEERLLYCAAQAKKYEMRILYWNFLNPLVVEIKIS